MRAQVQELHGSPWFSKATPTKGITALPPSTAQHAYPNESKQSHSFGAFKIQATKLAPRPLAVRRASHDLFECLEQSKNKRFSEKDAKYIFAQVVDVVDYLDKHGISHCDIKDENVVVDKNLKVETSMHQMYE